jgi:kynureninase
MTSRVRPESHDDAVSGWSLTREYAASLDAADPLARFRDAFVDDDPELIYLDGNSLGRLPKASADRLATVVRDEWGTGLIRSWSHWVDLPARVGDLIGSALIGATGGQTTVSDSTTVNLYKLAVAALDARPDRTVIVTDDDNFPTDRYVFEGLAAQRGLELRAVHSDPDEGLDLDVLRDAVDGDTALVSLSHVAYRSGALLDMGRVNRLVHDAGALVLWDLCHSAGSVPVELDATGTDLAVGCTYKYLNAGPGAPAFLYVRRGLQEELRQPIWGWFGQRGQFGMGPSYDPVPGIERFLAGTPAILGVAAVEEGVRLLAEAGIGRLRAKGVALTEYLISLVRAWLPELTLATPADPRRRGSHVSLHHPDAWRFTQALIDAKVIPDYRTPDRLRLGPAPITARFTDVWDALTRLRRIIDEKAYERYPVAQGRVT